LILVAGSCLILAAGLCLILATRLRPLSFSILTGTGIGRLPTHAALPTTATTTAATATCK
jgi:hypothetical protein